MKLRTLFSNYFSYLKSNPPIGVAVGFIGLTILIFGGIALSIFFFNVENSHELNNLSKTGLLGDTFNGLIGPFVAFLAVVLTFIAFWMQYEANREQKLQFERQNQDQLFFRLFDSQESKIVNSSFRVNELEISSFQLLEHIVSEFRKEITIECRLLAREIVRNQFETLREVFYHKMLKANAIPFERFESEKNRFISDMNSLDSNSRWDYIKNYLGSLGGETKGQIEVLEAIGTVYFYKVDFQDRKNIYSRAYETIEHKYGSFLDGYFKGLEYISELINSSLKRKFICNIFCLKCLVLKWYCYFITWRLVDPIRIFEISPKKTKFLRVFTCFDHC